VLFEKLCEMAHERNEATHAASTLEVDDVIDPADTRARLELCLKSVPVGRRRKRGAVLDAWRGMVSESGVLDNNSYAALREMMETW